MKTAAIPWRKRARWALGNIFEDRVWPALHFCWPGISVAALIAGIMLAFHWGYCAFAPTEIHPVEGTTSEIYFERRHWFGRTEHIKLEARRDENGDWQWMFEGKDGKWHTFFRFE